MASSKQKLIFNLVANLMAAQPTMPLQISFSMSAPSATSRTLVAQKTAWQLLKGQVLVPLMPAS